MSEPITKAPKSTICPATRPLEARLVISFLGVRETSSTTLCVLDWKWPDNTVILFGYAFSGSILLPPRSVAQMLRYVRDDDAWPGKQCCFQAKRSLVMQGIFPPVSHHKFRQNHCQGLLRMQLMHRIDVGKERTDERPVRRLNHDQLHLTFLSEMLLQLSPPGIEILNFLRICSYMRN